MIIFILLKLVDAVLRIDTLMLRILIKTTSAVRLPRVEILILKLLRILNISVIYILSARPIFAGLRTVVEWLTGGIVVDQIALVGVVHNWT